jgi:hypothetical protein
MTVEINYELISEILFTNEETFIDIAIKKAHIVACTCKIARTNKNIKLSYYRFKAREYFEKINDVVFNSIIYKKRKQFLLQENISEVDEEEFNIINQYDNIIDELKKENENVLEGFRELIVLEFKEYIYNYENWKGDSFDVQNYLDYCDQYFYIVDYFGYYEYYENHTYDPTHFVLTPDTTDYDFARALNNK